MESNAKSSRKSDRGVKGQRTAKRGICLKLDLIDSENPQWYKPFKRIGKQKIRKFKLFIVSIYLLIVFGSLVLHPYLFLVLTNGFAPIIKQPAFAYAYKEYIVLINMLNHNTTMVNNETGTVISALVEIFNSTLHNNDLILYTSLLAIPINVFFTLCLAFRFICRKLTLVISLTHFMLAATNAGIVAFVCWIYKTQGVNRKFLLDQQVISPNINHLDEQLHFHPARNGTFDNRVKSNPSFETYLLPLYGVLGLSVLLHILLSSFFVVRFMTGPSAAKSSSGSEAKTK